MNERIKDLEAEAYKYVNSVIHPDAYTTQEQYRWFHRITFNEKFAELLVAECLVTLDNIICDTSLERDTLWVARKVVSDHFGVE